TGDPHDHRAQRRFDAEHPRVRVRGDRARRLRQSSRRRRRWPHRRRRQCTHGAVHRRVERHRARGAVRLDPARVALPAGRLVRNRTNGARVNPRLTRALVTVVVAIAAVYVFGYWVAQQHEAPDVKLWTSAIYIGIAATGLNILTGYNGQVS